MKLLLLLAILGTGCQHVTASHFIKDCEVILLEADRTYLECSKDNSFKLKRKTK